jgi:membrane fusion protein, multidrug efflux system
MMRPHCGSPRRHWKFGGIVLCTMGVASLVAACGGEEEAAPEYVAVETLVVQPVRFEAELTTTGTVELPDDATLAAEVGGTVAMIVGEGATVGAGQVVAQLDARAERAGVASAQAAVLEARAVAEQTEDAYRRQAPLAADTIISPLELQRLRAERTQARARVLQAEAQLREAQDRLEQTRLRAPFGGTVEGSFVRRGEQVSPGTELLRIVRPGRAEIEAGVPGRYAGQVQVGSSATVDLTAYGIGMRVAPVTFVGTAIDPRSRTFPVRIEVPNPTGAIKADMVARVSLVWLVLPAAIVVPLEVVERDEQGESVLVAAAGAGAYFAQRRRVATGPRSEEGVVIESGLEAGDEIIITGGAAVASGEPVEITRRYPDIDAWRAALGQGGPAP